MEPRDIPRACTRLVCSVRHGERVPALWSGRAWCASLAMAYDPLRGVTLGNVDGLLADAADALQLSLEVDNDAHAGYAPAASSMAGSRGAIARRIVNGVERVVPGNPSLVEFVGEHRLYKFDKVSFGANCGTYSVREGRYVLRAYRSSELGQRAKMRVPDC